MKKKIFWSILLTGLMMPFVRGQKVSASVDRDSILIGEQIKYVLSTLTDTISQITFPRHKVFGNLEVVEILPVDTSHDQNKLQLKQTYFLTAWDSGHYVIPSLPVRINDSVFYTDSIRVYVKDVVVDTTKQGLYGFKPVIPINYKPKVKIRQSGWWRYAWLILLLLIPVAIYYLRKKKVLSPEEVLSPYEKAIRRWNKIYADKERIPTDELYVELTDILRTYIEETTGLPAKERISTHLIQDLYNYVFENGEKINPSFITQLKETLKRADLAKFAKLKPYPPEQEKDVENIKQIIDHIQNILNKIEEEKEREERIRREQIKREKRKKRIIASATGLLVLIIGGWLIHKYLGHKISSFTGQVVAIVDQIPPPSKWFEVSYGSSPSFKLKTPVVSVADETYFPPDTLSNVLEEYVFLRGNAGQIEENIWIWDLKKEMDKTELLSLLKTQVEEKYGPVEWNIHEDNVLQGVIKNNPDKKIKGRLMYNGKKFRTLILVYPEGEKHEKIVDEIIFSTQTDSEEQ